MSKKVTKSILSSFRPTFRNVGRLFFARVQSFLTIIHDHKQCVCVCVCVWTHSCEQTAVCIVHGRMWAVHGRLSVLYTVDWWSVLYVRDRHVLSHAPLLWMFWSGIISVVTFAIHIDSGLSLWPSPVDLGGGVGWGVLANTGCGANLPPLQTFDLNWATNVVLFFKVMVRRLNRCRKTVFYYLGFRKKYKKAEDPWRSLERRVPA